MPPGLPIMNRAHLRVVHGTSQPDSEGVLPRQDYMTFLVTCPHCKEETGLRVPSAGAVEWQRGALIQDAFPDLGETDRERLLTGICQPCWDKMAEEAEEAEPDPQDHDFECADGWGDMCKHCGESEMAHEGD